MKLGIKTSSMYTGRVNICWTEAEYEGEAYEYLYDEVREFGANYRLCYFAI